MPAGGEVLGYAYYAATKWAGYTAFCHWVLGRKLKPSANTTPKLPSSLLAGGVRTLIGITIGAIVGLSFWKIPAFKAHGDLPDVLFFTLLVPLRIGEWWILLKTIYKEFPNSTLSKVWIILMGIVASFALDALGIFAMFVLPGGMWIC